MNTNHQLIRQGVGGNVLIITLTFLAVALLVFVSVFFWAGSNATVTVRNNQYNMSQNAAEAAVERVVGQIDRDFISLSITNSGAYYGSLVVNNASGIDQSSWPVQYTFSDTNGTAGQIGVIFGPQATTTQPLNSQYSGLYGLAQQIDIYATATPIGQPQLVPATIHESLQFANIPLFQFAIFYNVNLEIMSAAGLNIYGPVFCNQNIWEGSTLATFYSTVAAVGTNAPQVQDPFCDYTGSGASTFLKGKPVDHANPLVMPIGTNNSPGAVVSLLELPPANYAMGTSAAYSSNGIVYPANAADLVITNFASGTNDGATLPTGTNFAVYFQDNSLVQLPYDFYIMTNRSAHSVFTTNYVPSALYSNIVFATFTWVTNARFYDSREGWNKPSSSPTGPPKRVEAVQIDVGLFNKWMTNTAKNGGSDASAGAVNPDPTKVLHTHHHLDSIYVYTSVLPTSSQLPAVRVTDGAFLPSSAGLTVATQFPMYVLGNYNVQDTTGSAVGLYGTNGATTHTYPAALMADAVTILSSSWGDNVTSLQTSGGTAAQSTTVNAAMLEGIVPSDPTKTGNVGLNGDYSGGVENFLRLLENWSSSTLTYNGSIVVLFYSQYATNNWRQTGHYYSAPTRHWAFDLNYEQSAKLPPLTPQIKAMIRGNWYAHE